MDEKLEARVRQTEVDIGTIKSALDWAKTYATVWMAIVLGFFALMTTILLNTRSELNAKIEVSNSKIESKIEALSARLGDEFRAQRQDLNAQTSALANAITAAKTIPRDLFRSADPDKDGTIDALPPQKGEPTRPRK